MIRPPSARNQPGGHKHFWPSDVLPPRLEGAVGYICKKVTPYLVWSLHQNLVALCHTM